MDRSAKMVILLLTYDQPRQVANPLTSVKFFADFLRTVRT